MDWVHRLWWMLLYDELNEWKIPSSPVKDFRKKEKFENFNKHKGLRPDSRVAELAANDWPILKNDIYCKLC
jgi:hypothetical protein